MTKKVYIKTLGCQMNVRDSEVVAGLLKQAGFEVVESLSGADIVLFNTCAVRDHAEERVWSEVGRVARNRRVNYPLKPDNDKQKLSGDRRQIVPIIGLLGCMARNYGQDVFRRAPYVDFVVGPRDIAKAPEIINKIVSAFAFNQKSGDGAQAGIPLLERKIWEIDGEARPEEIYHTGFRRNPDHAYVVISEGCSNYCFYCVVPYVRGPLYNRRHKDILREIEQALDQGISKVTLLGQNVNAYKDDKTSFIKLIELVNKLKGLKEFNFITSHPKDSSGDLFKAMAGAEKLKKDLHMPLQSGSDRILKLMNRGYTAKNYLDLVRDYRRIVKAGTLTTDLILGFPTETEEDFQQTYRLVEQVRFNAAYIFKYSPRPHSAARDMADDVSVSEKARRHREMLELQRGISKVSL